MTLSLSKGHNLFCIIDNVLNDLINFFWSFTQISLREKLRQNNRAHTGNESLPIFSIHIYFARQAKSDFNILIQKFIGKLCVAKLNNLKRLSFKTLLG